MNRLLFSAATLGFVAAASMAFAQEEHPGADKPSEAARPGATQGHRSSAPTRHAAPAHAPASAPAARAETPHAGPTPEASANRNTASVTTRRTADNTNLNRNVQSPNHYHAGAYRPPEGYAEQRWTYGQRLPAAYFASSYWLTDYVAYALFAPPSGAVWVRVGDDALLIDQGSGQVIQVQYGVFY
jgi:Ni/Co efflux regulator RcnB